MEIIKTKIGENGISFKPIGRIDVNTAAEFGTTINDELDDVKELVIDFDEIVYISSIGLRVLLELQKRMNSQGVMKLIRVKPEVMEVFKMTGFSNILNII
ncbi:MAG: STAS domain-containing protein [bacterium]|nr:STAS domain-containing protein [bacterium]